MTWHAVLDDPSVFVFGSNRRLFTHPVHLHDLEPLRDVGRVGGQPGASGDEAHEEDPLLVGELLQSLPEPLDQGVLLVHLPVPHHLLQHVAADLRHAAHHLLQLLGRQQRQQRHRHDPRHALTHRRHLTWKRVLFRLSSPEQNGDFLFVFRFIPSDVCEEIQNSCGRFSPPASELSILFHISSSLGRMKKSEEQNRTVPDQISSVSLQYAAFHSDRLCRC